MASLVVGWVVPNLLSSPKVITYIKPHVDSVTLASVCSGDQLNLTCHAASNETLLLWSVTSTSLSVSQRRFISSDSNATSVTPLTVGQTMFQFFRTSTSPLISTMTIDNVSTSLNGTRVECSYGSEVTETTIITVIGNGMLVLLLNYY